MKKGELIIAICWAMLGAFIAVISYGLKIGNVHHPGPGLMPFVLGMCLILCSIPILVGSSLEVFSRTKKDEDGIWKGVNLKKILLVVGCLFLYPLILEKMGYLVTTFIVFLFFFKLAGIGKWRFALLASFLTAVISYFFFNALLEGQLPFVAGVRAQVPSDRVGVHQGRNGRVVAVGHVRVRLGRRQIAKFDPP